MINDDGNEVTTNIKEGFISETIIGKSPYIKERTINEILEEILIELRK